MERKEARRSGLVLLSVRNILRIVLLAAIWTAANAGASRAAELLLKDGRLLRGKMGEVSELCETPTTQKRGGDNAPLVTFLDDNLRRTYFSTRLIKEVRPEENRPLEEKFTIWQHAKHGGGLVVKSVGLPVAIGEFDEFGRRNFTMVTERGTLTVTQGITELTPQWAKVEATSHIWDMRIATSSIPRDTLQKILWKQIDLANAKLNKIDPTKAEGYKKIARFYLQSERYSEARAVLNALLEASPDRDELKEQLAPSLEAIKQLQREQVVHESQFRHNAGQHQFVSRLLRQFPSEGVNGETLQIVRDMLQEHDTREARRRAVAGSLKALAGRIPNLIAKENLKPILDGDRRRDQPQHARPHGGVPAKRRRPANARLREARAGHQRLAAGCRRRYGQAAHGDLGLPRPRLYPPVPRRPARPRARTDLRLYQGRAGRRSGDGGRPAGPHEAAAAAARAGGRAAGLLRAPGRRAWPRSSR